ncbi:MAG: 4-hydroxy-3-methylbut-2-enyl diphosphate reductase, partial [Eggerthellaceae bacterium]|nr:4-hydroxy-3-methylbut-2-enyl diphosphate reductase [Eggerthellaceae bacterium]
MKVVRADQAGACYGVQRALEMAQGAIDEYVRVYTLGPLIHNPKVVSDLEAKSIECAYSVKDIEDAPMATVIVRS